MQEEMEDLQSEWKKHPSTEAFLRNLRKRRDEQVTVVLRAAYVSEDAHVRAAAGALNAINDVIHEVENGQK